ncbi:MAG: phosphonate ABC transporter ATP-binding protein [Planctomycetes bacterium]|nr:phosphonate ABC transporter ATP-binding protein [Planctomycetota bacterium]
MDIAVDGLCKTFRSGSRLCCALHQIDLRIRAGEMVALLGSSGSGKSTLMRHLNGLALGDCGSVRIGGLDVQHRGRIHGDVRRVRAQVGMIFQQFNLVGRLSVATNVLAGMLHRLPLWRSLTMRFTRAERLAALDALDRVGLVEQAWQRASTLSGGQQQRAAIARTLVQKARLILGDEPIASLDPESAKRVMDDLAAINREDGTTVVVSLHQVDFALAYCPRTVALRAGRVVFDGPSIEITPEILREVYGGDAASQQRAVGSSRIVRPAHSPPAAAVAAV